MDCKRGRAVKAKDKWITEWIMLACLRSRQQNWRNSGNYCHTKRENVILSTEDRYYKAYIKKMHDTPMVARHG